MKSKRGIKRVLLSAGILAAGLLAASTAPPPSLPVEPDTDEEIIPKEQLSANSQCVTGMAWHPDGSRLYLAEQNGNIRVYDPANGLQTAFFATVAPLYYDWSPFGGTTENGLLGIALHPDFANQPYVYVHFTSAYPPGRAETRIVRYRDVLVDGNHVGTDAAVIAKFDVFYPSHKAGMIAFGSDGMLYVTKGDATGNAPQYVTNLGGKILRIDPDTGLGLPDNPFWNGDPTSDQSKVYTLGHRNPFGLAARPGTNEFVSTENSGPSDRDEINLILPGRNYGWPVREGNDLGYSSGSSGNCVGRGVEL